MTAPPFHIIDREPGPSGLLPTWSDQDGAITFRDAPKTVRADVSEVPGAFQLLDVLHPDETAQFLAAADRMGFRPESPISLPRSVRHNDNVNWVVSDPIHETLWARSAPHIPEHVGRQVARGLNGRFRFYRYGEGDYFSAHTDGAWPASRVVDGRAVAQADPGLFSQYTYLVFLDDDFDGGETEFYVRKSDPALPARRNDDLQIVRIRTPAGSVLCFPHGTHPLHCVHSSAPITRGTKTIIRTDLLFGLPEEGAP